MRDEVELLPQAVQLTLLVGSAGRLWQELDFITLAPMRQYKHFIWFERAEPPRFMATASSTLPLRGQGRHVRGEDGAAGRGLSGQGARGRQRRRAGGVRDYFDRITANVRAVEQARAAAEPSHLEALLAFAARAYRRPLSKAEQDDLLAFYRSLREQDLSHEDAVRDTLVSVLMSPHFCYRVDPLPAGRGAHGDAAAARRITRWPAG